MFDNPLQYYNNLYHFMYYRGGVSCRTDWTPDVSTGQQSDRFGVWEWWSQERT